MLMSGPMVRAILGGRKTQTRRTLRVPNHPAVADWVMDSEYRAAARAESEAVAQQFVTTFPHGRVKCPYGVPGDRLWVREAWAYHLDVPISCMDGKRISRRHIVYKADHAPDSDTAYTYTFKPSIHMYRWASRITLEVTDVRVERVQSISEDDAIAEGTPDAQQESHRANYSVLWDAIDGAGSWSSNPWVWVVQFHVVGAPGADALAGVAGGSQPHASASASGEPHA